LTGAKKGGDGAIDEEGPPSAQIDDLPAAKWPLEDRAVLKLQIKSTARVWKC